MLSFLNRLLAAGLLGATLCSGALAQSDRPPALLPLASEAAAKLAVYPPIPEALARGVVIIQFHADNLRIMPVFGPKASEVTPRLGHLHVTVDDWHGTWAHTSADPIILVGLTPGPHRILLEVADPNHRILTSETVNVTVPNIKGDKSHEH